MSEYHKIFIRTDVDVETLVGDLSLAVGAELRELGGPEASCGEYAYGGTIGDHVIEIMLQHEYDEDFGIPFPEYPVEVTFRNIHSDKEQERVFAESVLNKLGEKGCSALLVFGLSRLLGRRP
ncbi:hypothetical protein ABGB12_26045 [Actinocorallia sp. B10E7]|uniref:hypothetical protein n=1 Tax=Actinocorallia sp. B10E7 TaxID=3153558 RepID=UPI00325D5832